MSPEWNDRFIYFSAIGTFISFIGIGRLFVKDKSKQIQINELKNIAASSSQIEKNTGEHKNLAELELKVKHKPILEIVIRNLNGNATLEIFNKNTTLIIKDIKILSNDISNLNSKFPFTLYANMYEEWSFTLNKSNVLKEHKCQFEIFYSNEIEEKFVLSVNKEVGQTQPKLIDKKID